MNGRRASSSREAHESPPEAVAAETGARSAPSKDCPPPDVSVVVLVSERPGDLQSLYREYARALRSEGLSCEFVFVLEPWNAEDVSELRAMAWTEAPVRVLEANNTVGDAALLRLGASASRAEVILTLPGYRRVEASCVEGLLNELGQGADLVVARRYPRRDSWINRVQTRAFHLLLRWMTGVELRDVGSGVRAMRRSLLDELPLYGDFYRFLPVFAVREGYSVRQVEAPQHAEDRGTRVYGPGTYARRLIDLVGVFFLTRFTYKPLRFFGLVGTTLAVGGAAVLLVVFFQRLGGEGIADRPLLLLGVLLVTLGVQGFALGLIGEIIVHFNVPGRRRYRLKRQDPPPD